VLHHTGRASSGSWTVNSGSRTGPFGHAFDAESPQMTPFWTPSATGDPLGHATQHVLITTCTPLIPLAYQEKGIWVHVVEGADMLHR